MQLELGRGFLAVGLLLLLLNGLFPPVAFVGYIVALYGLKILSNFYGRADIYKNFLYAFVFYAVSLVLLAAVLLAAASQPRGGEFNWAAAGAVFATLWAVGVASAFFARRAYLALGEVSGVAAFRTAARLIWIGALTTIILVGPVITFIGLIFAVVGALALRGG